MARPGPANAATANTAKNVVVPALPGRPRDPAIDDAILDATRSLLREVGYQQLSFETVARRAGVTRPTIYRRWPSKMHLVHEAVFPSSRLITAPVSDDVGAELGQLVRKMVASYARPEAQAALPGLIADLHDERAARASVVEPLNRGHANASPTSSNEPRSAARSPHPSTPTLCSTRSPAPSSTASSPGNFSPTRLPTSSPTSSSTAPYHVEAGRRPASAATLGQNLGSWLSRRTLALLVH